MSYPGCRIWASAHHVLSKMRPAMTEKNYRRTAKIFRSEVAVYMYRDSQVRLDFGLKWNVKYIIFTLNNITGSGHFNCN